MLEKLERGRLCAALLALVVSVGCGGEGGGAGGAAASGPQESPVDPATAGSVAGTVTFTGTAPAPQPIDMREEPVCADKHATQPTRASVVVGPDGGLANVFVYVKSGPVTDMRFPVSSDRPVLDQDGCIYDPHVVGLQVGQTMVVRNSDAVLHNVNAQPRENRPFNRTQPQAGMEFTHAFTAAEVMIPIRCDVHGWMESYVGVTAHPYNAVTGNAGSFSLDNLPPGDYEVEAWHERYGTLTQNVTVPPSGRAEVTFEFNDRMAGRPVPMGEPLVVDHETGTLRPAGSGHAHSGQN
jgi:plastocyanin